jgi:uncharacterized protein YaiE (UPF0345 family)
MGGSIWVQAGPYILFGAAALSLFAIGSLRTNSRRPAPARIADDGKTAMMPLMEAAEAVYETARRERMVIVTVAERARGQTAVEWFAQSIAGVVPVYRVRDSNTFEKLDAANVGAELQSLYIRKRDYQTYVRWARPMQ